MGASAFALDKNIVVCNIIHVLTLDRTVTTCGGVHTSYLNKILAHVNMICICYKYTTTLAIPRMIPTPFLLLCTSVLTNRFTLATCLEWKHPEITEDLCSRCLVCILLLALCLKKTVHAHMNIAHFVAHARNCRVDVCLMCVFSGGYYACLLCEK